MTTFVKKAPFSKAFERHRFQRITAKSACDQRIRNQQFNYFKKLEEKLQDERQIADIVPVSLASIQNSTPLHSLNDLLRQKTFKLNVEMIEKIDCGATKDEEHRFRAKITEEEVHYLSSMFKTYSKQIKELDSKSTQNQIKSLLSSLQIYLDEAGTWNSSLVADFCNLYFSLINRLSNITFGSAALKSIKHVIMMVKFENSDWPIHYKLKLLFAIKDFVARDDFDKTQKIQLLDTIDSIWAKYKESVDTLPLIDLVNFGKSFMAKSDASNFKCLSTIFSRLSEPSDDIFLIVKTAELWIKFISKCSESDFLTYARYLNRFHSHSDVTSAIRAVKLQTSEDISLVLSLLSSLEEILAHIRFPGNFEDRRTYMNLKSTARFLDRIGAAISKNLAGQVHNLARQNASQSFDLLISLVRFSTRVTTNYSIDPDSQLVCLLSSLWDQRKDSISDAQLELLVRTIFSCKIDGNLEQLARQLTGCVTERLEAQFVSSNGYDKLISFSGMVLKLTKHFLIGHDYSRLIKIYVNRFLRLTTNDHLVKFSTIVPFLINTWERVPEKAAVSAQFMKLAQNFFESKKFKNDQTSITAKNIFVFCNLLKIQNHHVERHEDLDRLIESASLLKDHISTCKDESFKSVRLHVSSAQSQLYTLFNQFQIPFEKEKFLMFTNVDLFAEPNIIVEVLGEFHFYNDEVDNYTKVKKQIFQQCGFKTFYLTDSYLKLSENKTQLVQLIKKTLQKKNLAN